MLAPDRRPTPADLAAAADPSRPNPELMHGEITYKASPRAAHSHAQGELKVELRHHGSGHGGGWWILTEPDVQFDSQTVLVPDIAGWKRTRLPELPDGRIRTRPDWVCEVLSPGHVARDRVLKRDLYRAHGVPHLWLVSPEERTLEAFALREAFWILLGTWSGGQVAIPPFDSIDVDALFVPGAIEPPAVGEPAVSYG